MAERKAPTPPPDEPRDWYPTNPDDLALLGLRVRDRITGFSGICSSVSYDLYGCIQAVIAPTVNEKGEIPDGRWFDIARLVVIDPTPVMNVPGGRFAVLRRSTAPEPSKVSGPAEKPARA